MVWRMKGFVSRVKEGHPDVFVTHCFWGFFFFFVFFAPGGTRCQDFNRDLAPGLEDVVHMINVVKARPLKRRIFACLCEKMGVEQ